MLSIKPSILFPEFEDVSAPFLGRLSPFLSDLPCAQTDRAFFGRYWGDRTDGSKTSKSGPRSQE